MSTQTTVYFIRHAESDQSVRQDDIRPLTAKGLADAEALVTKFDGIALDAIYSSPYLRAEQTVLPLAKARRMPIHEVWDFRERRVDSSWIEDYDAFARKQWADHEYKLNDGESIADAQRRNIAALNPLLEKYAGKAIAIGTHGGCLGSILNHYDPSFGYEQFRELLPKMPCVMRLAFDGQRCADIQELFARQGVVPVDASLRAQVTEMIQDAWDSPFIASCGRLTDARAVPGFAYMKDGAVRGCAMYRVDGVECELVVLEALDEGEGIGSALLARVIAEARRAGCRRLYLVTSNDNTHAIRFYQRRGMELCAVRLGAIDEARRTIKPQIPEKGDGGIPIRHEFEFEVKL